MLINKLKLYIMSPIKMEEKNINCICNEPISAFAFNTAKALEAFLDNHNKGLQLEHQMLQAKVLDFWGKLTTGDQEYYGTYENTIKAYQKQFSIKEETEGNI